MPDGLGIEELDIDGQPRLHCKSGEVGALGQRLSDPFCAPLGIRHADDNLLNETRLQRRLGTQLAISEVDVQCERAADGRNKIARKHAERANAARQVAMLKSRRGLGHHKVGVEHARQRTAYKRAVNSGHHGHRERAELEESVIDLAQHQGEHGKRQLGDRLELVRVAANGKVLAFPRQQHRLDSGRLRRHHALDRHYCLEHRVAEARAEGVEVLGVVQLKVCHARATVESQLNQVVLHRPHG
mmetsp:Transcript_9667/g.27944  ORF Transcript_9667/g.27944 Transcript_9667/m.27944 type:complete len:243 (-) Transcript_9667:5107-5835(-)